MADIRQRAVPQAAATAASAVLQRAAMPQRMPPQAAPPVQRFMGPPTPAPVPSRGHAGVGSAIGGNPVSGTSGGAMTRSPFAISGNPTSGTSGGAMTRAHNTIMRQHTSKAAFTRSRARTV